MVSFDLSARLARRQLRRFRAQSSFPEIQQSNLPILFANSFPKSGTHLLTQILNGFRRFGPFVNSGLPPVRSFEGQSGVLRDPELLAKEVERFLPGDIGYGHAHAYPELIKLLTAPEMATFFIYRDPRDVVVSHVHYVVDINSQHVHHRYYTESLNSFDERLETSIRGLPEAEHPFPDIGERFAPYLEWLDQKAVHSLRFEDLIKANESVFHKIIDFVVLRGFEVEQDTNRLVRLLRKSIDPEKSPTFRSGKIGSWKKSFANKHKEIFKDLAGDLLIQLGYEKDRNW